MLLALISVSAPVLGDRIHFSDGESIKGTLKSIGEGKVVWQNGQLDVTRGADRNVQRPCHQAAFGAVEKQNAARRPSPVKRRVSVQQTP